MQPHNRDGIVVTEKENIILKIKKGDKEAFNALCQDELPSLLSYARLFLAEGWAEDVVQDVLYSFWRNRENLSEGGSVRGYLLRSVYNRAMNYLRKERLSSEFRAWNDVRIAMLGLDGSDPEKNPTIRNLFDGDLHKSLDEAIAGLPPKCREVFKMSYIEDIPNKEISARLGVSLSTVENHIYSALKQLRKTLSNEKALIFFTLLPYLDIILRDGLK